MKLIRDILTDYDSRTYDTGRVLAVLCVCALIVLQGVALFRGGTFDAMAFGGGVAAIVGALGLAIFGDNARRP